MLFASLGYRTNRVGLEELRDVYHRRMGFAYTNSGNVNKMTNDQFIQATMNNLKISSAIGWRLVSNFKDESVPTTSRVSSIAMTHAETVFELKLFPMAFTRYNTMKVLMEKVLNTKVVVNNKPISYDSWKEAITPFLKQAIQEKVLVPLDETHEFIDNAVEDEMSGWKADVKFENNINSLTKFTYGAAGYNSASVKEVFKIIRSVADDSAVPKLIHDVLEHIVPLVTTIKPTGVLKVFKSNKMDTDGEHIAKDVMLLLAIFIDLRGCILSQYATDLIGCLEFWYANDPEHKQK